MFVETAIGMAPAFGGNAVQAADNLLQNYRTQQIADFLEEYWRQGMGAWPQLNLGLAAAPAIANHAEAALLNGVDVVGPLPIPPANVDAAGWHHLIYAYMIENTRVMDIFRRVVFEYLHGERLPRPTHDTLRWLRVTEELFFSAPRSLTVRSTTSNLRPDDCATRRNAYHRMFGMDLNHGTEDGRPYSYVKADVSNREFVVLWETLLAEVWRGFQTRTPLFSGEDQSDDVAIITLVRRLREMLLARRLNGVLSREEFDAVACLSWFHLVVTANTQVCTNLTAAAAGEADRLKHIGNLVGLSAHTRSDAYFRLAQPMSIVLRDIENGNVELQGAQALYNPPAAAIVNWQNEMQQIITNWSIATGRNIKDPSHRTATLPVLTGGPTYTASNGNGSRAPSRIPANLLR